MILRAAEPGATGGAAVLAVQCARLNRILGRPDVRGWRPPETPVILDSPRSSTPCRPRLRDTFETTSCGGAHRGPRHRPGFLPGSLVRSSTLPFLRPSVSMRSSIKRLTRLFGSPLDIGDYPCQCSPCEG